MDTLFNDEFINNKVLKRLIKEVKKGQIKRTINNIDCYNELRKKLNRKYDFTPSQNQQLEMLKYEKYAKRSLQA